MSVPRELTLKLRPGRVNTCEFNETLLNIAANWLAARYNLDGCRVLKVLQQTAVREPIEIDDYFIEQISVALIVDRLVFSPSLPNALSRLEANFALELFEKQPLEVVERMLADLQSAQYAHQEELTVDIDHKGHFDCDLDNWIFHPSEVQDQAKRVS